MLAAPRRAGRTAGPHGASFPCGAGADPRRPARTLRTPRERSPPRWAARQTLAASPARPRTRRRSPTLMRPAVPRTGPESMTTESVLQRLHPCSTRLRVGRAMPASSCRNPGGGHSPPYALPRAARFTPCDASRGVNPAAPAGLSAPLLSPPRSQPAKRSPAPLRASCRGFRPPSSSYPASWPTAESRRSCAGPSRSAGARIRPRPCG